MSIRDTIAQLRAPRLPAPTLPTHQVLKVTHGRIGTEVTPTRYLGTLDQCQDWCRYETGLEMASDVYPGGYESLISGLDYHLSEFVNRDTDWNYEAGHVLGSPTDWAGWYHQPDDFAQEPTLIGFLVIFELGEVDR